MGSVLTLSPAILSVAKKEEFIVLSMVLIMVFLVLNIGFIVQSKKELLTKNIVNIVGGLLSGALFLTYIIYVYG